jgi:hypothetical protein
MHGRRIVAALAVVALLITARPAAAGGDSVRREGSCSGPGDWHLRVSRETATTIRVRFDIEHVDPGDSWQLFLSDNGHRIYSATKVAGAGGEVHAKKITSDRAGTDRVKASGVDVTSGGSCDGALTY